MVSDRGLAERTIERYVEDVRELEKDFEERGLEALDEWLEYVLDVSRTQGRTEKGWVTTGYTLTLTLGGPNVYLEIDGTDVGKLELYWGGSKAVRIVRSPVLRELFDYLNEIYGEE